MSKPKLVSLEMWAASRYGDSPPSKKTLRAWARTAKIVPVPKKEGRRYVVREDARFIDYDDPDYVAALNESASSQHGQA